MLDAVEQNIASLQVFYENDLTTHKQAFEAEAERCIKELCPTNWFIPRLFPPYPQELKDRAWIFLDDRHRKRGMRIALNGLVESARRNQMYVAQKHALEIAEIAWIMPGRTISRSQRPDLDAEIVRTVLSGNEIPWNALDGIFGPKGKSDRWIRASFDRATRTACELFNVEPPQTPNRKKNLIGWVKYQIDLHP